VKPYAPPVLIEFGKISRFTLGGSGAVAEGMATMNTTRFP